MRALGIPLVFSSCLVVGFGSALSFAQEGERCDPLTSPGSVKIDSRSALGEIALGNPSCPHLIAKKAALEAGTEQVPPGESASAPGTVEGAEHPEAIPDDVAFRLFIRTVATPAQPLPSELSRSRAILRMAGFEGREAEAIRALATDYVGRSEALDRTLRAELAGGRRSDARERFRRSQAALVRAMMDSLPARLGADTAELFRRHLDEHVKKRIAVVPVGQSRQRPSAASAR